MLTACGETTLLDTSEQNPVDNTQETPLPESCQLYYDLGDASVLAEDKSLPLAQNAVFRGGTFETDQWDSTVVPTFILSGGDATCTDWLPQGTSIEVGASTITANGPLLGHRPRLRRR